MNFKLHVLQERRVDSCCGIIENGFYLIIYTETKMVQTFKKGIFDHNNNNNKHRQEFWKQKLSQTDQMGTRVLPLHKTSYITDYS